MRSAAQGKAAVSNHEAVFLQMRLPSNLAGNIDPENAKLSFINNMIR
jgi:hypothetical protein